MNELLANPLTWVTVAFLIFAIGVSKPIWRLLTQGLDARAARIKAELDEAIRLREEAQATLAAYQKKQRESLAEAEQILSQTRRQAEAIALQAEQDLKLALDKRMSLSLERIAQAENKVVDEIRDHVIDLALAAARTIIKEHVTGTHADDLLKNALGEIQQKLH